MSGNDQCFVENGEDDMIEVAGDIRWVGDGSDINLRACQDPGQWFSGRRNS